MRASVLCIDRSSETAKDWRMSKRGGDHMYIGERDKAVKLLLPH